MGIILAAITLIFGVYCIVKQFTRERPRPPMASYDLTPWGEVIEFPRELRPARKNGGGVSEQGGRAGMGHVRTHDERAIRT